MRLGDRLEVPGIAVGLLAMDVILAAIFLFQGLLYRPGWFWKTLFDLNGEGNLPTWYASMKLAAVGVILGLGALARLRDGGRAIVPLIAVALFFVALSLDEIAQIHEFVGWETDVYLLEGGRKASAFSKTGLWMVVAGVPVAILILVLAVDLSRRGLVTRQLAFLAGAGFAIFVLSAFGLEALSNFIGPNTRHQVILTAFEESGEMVGVSIIFWATWLQARLWGVGLHVGLGRRETATVVEHSDRLFKKDTLSK